MIKSLEVGDKFTVPEEFMFCGARFMPDTVYTVVNVSDDYSEIFTVSPGGSSHGKWHFTLADEHGNLLYNNFEPLTSDGPPSSSVRLRNALRILTDGGKVVDGAQTGSPESFESVARKYLVKAIKSYEDREAEESENKELEDLALKLLNANNELFGLDAVPSWSEVVSPHPKSHWVDMAKEAKKFFSDK